jgi:hypothetical protein
LKIARAEHHLVRVAWLRIIRRVITTGQCVLTGRVNRLTGGGLEITEPLNPQIAIVLGGLLFNIRSALARPARSASAQGHEIDPDRVVGRRIRRQDACSV